MYQRVVTKLWQGKYVSVRDYEVTKAINMGGLIITHDGKKMQLSVDELKTLKPNPKPIQSKFKGTYKLVNITFKPLTHDPMQGDFLYDWGYIMVKFMLKESSDEVIYLRKLLQKHKADILNEKLSEEEKVKAVDNFIRITNIIYAKLDFVKKI